MTKTLKKNILRTISGSIGRYLSILLIVLLGVGFFSGLRMTKQSMLAVESEYLRNGQLNDLRLISTIGFDDADVAAARAVEGTVSAEGSVCADFITVFEGQERVLRAHALLKGINQAVVVEGRMPKAGNELLVDADKFQSDIIGRTISLAAFNTEDTMKNFRYGEYKIVGRARTPLYLHAAAGTTSLGSGSLGGFVLMPESGFEYEYYTELYLKTFDEYEPYSDAYDSDIDNYADIVKAKLMSSVQQRFDDLLADAEDKIAEAEATLASETAEAEQELADAELELADAEQELADAGQELADAKKKLEDAYAQLCYSQSQINENEKMLQDSEVTLNSAKASLDQAAQQIEAGAAGWDEALSTARQQLSDGQTQLDESIAAGQAQLDSIKMTLDNSEAAYSAGADQLAANRSEYENALAIWNQSAAPVQAQREQYNANMQAYEAGSAAYQSALAQLDAVRDTLAPEELAAQEAALSSTADQLAAQLTLLQQADAQLSAAEMQLKEALAPLDAAKAQIDAGQAELDSTRAQLDEGWTAYVEGVSTLEATQAEQQALLDQSAAKLDAFAAGVAEYQTGKQKLENGKVQLWIGRMQWIEGKAEYDKGIREYEEGVQEYEEGARKYEEGVREYEDGVRELQEKVAEAEEEIQAAKDELAELLPPELYVLKRSESNSGYITFNSDSDIVANVAKVFPIFFFMVAALICSTTMTRMVDDDRTQNGALRAMGYSKGQLFAKYLIYSGSAALIGSVAGFFIGGYLFPLVIWKAYQMLYCIDGYICVYQWDLLAVTTAAALLCSAGTTYFALRRQMGGTPADLIRPAAPPAGKRVLLERIPFLWNRLRFMHKITVRNIFRFKKRMFMMLLGISGCTALLLTGFGIDDSVADIAEYQYNDIQVFDINTTAAEHITESLLSDIWAENGEELTSVTTVLMSSSDVIANGAKKSAYIVASDDESITEAVHFFLGTESVPYPQRGEVLLSEKMAEQMNITVGDAIELSVSDTERGKVKVSGIVENHVYNYVYMTGATYFETFGKTYEPKNLLLCVTDGADAYRVAARISSRDDVSAVSVVQDTRKMVENMMQSLDYVVALVVTSAAALAFIVLFNLGNINISERVREIATIKVLGFHRRETGAYVFRENLILTVMGIIIGLPLGVLMHSFVMNQINVDMVSFVTQIKPQSYLYSLALVLVFAFVTDLVLRRKINRIHMAESLKSIE